MDHSGNEGVSLPVGIRVLEIVESFFVTEIVVCDKDGKIILIFAHPLIVFSYIEPAVHIFVYGVKIR